MYIKNKEYVDELYLYVNTNIDLFSLLNDKSIAIAGGAGLIGTYLVDLLVLFNLQFHGKVDITIWDKDAKESKKRFSEYLNHDFFHLEVLDISSQFPQNKKIDYIVHAASNTSPIDYAMDPVGTLLTNVIGTDILLRYCLNNHVKRFLFCSSVEAYGRNNGDIDEFTEEYSGYVDCNTVRACYPSGKRAAESMCNAYNSQYGIDFTIARIGRIYGATVIKSDAKAPTQFIMNALKNEDVILKSDGMQEFSFCYVGDCAMAILFILLKGESGKAYNVADKNSKIRLRDFAAYAASAGNVKCVFQEQTAVEQKGYSSIRKATLNTHKVESLGWKAIYDVKNGLTRTLNYMKGISNE